jgi:hypothetical protein
MWYYSINGGQEGPFDETRLNQLLAEGAIHPDTYVWKDGMAEWTPLNQVRAVAGPGPGLQVVHEGTCSVCNRPVGADNLIDLVGRRVCADCKPTVVQAIREGVGSSALPGAISAWCDGRKVVTRDQAELPHRCYKCNAPATEAPLKRKLYWHPPGYYWLIVLGVITRIGILLYVIVAMIVRKRATIHAHLCPRHALRRKVLLIVGWSGFGLGLATLIAGAVLHATWVIITAPILLLAAMIARIAGGMPLRASRMKDGVIWLRGAGKEFLASLPPWAG